MDWRLQKGSKASRNVRGETLVTPPLRAEGILSIKYVFKILYRTHLDGLDTYEHIATNWIFKNPHHHW